MSSKKTAVAATEETAAETAAETVTEAAETENTTKTTAKKTATKTATPLMYVGPTLTGIAIQNRVYTEIPEGAQAVIAQDAELGNLFIPVSTYPKANRMLREKTGYIYNAYVKALKLKK